MKTSSQPRHAPRRLSVRLFHGAQATGFVLLSLIVNDGETLHRQIGYGLLAIWLVRVGWGLCTRSEDRLSRYAARRHALVLLLFLLMALTGITGWLQTTDAFWGEAWMMLSHEWLSYSLWPVIALHVLQQWQRARQLPVSPIRRMFRG